MMMDFVLTNLIDANALDILQVIYLPTVTSQISN